MSLCLVYKVVEDVVYLFPDVGSQSKKFSINSVKSRLEEISLSRILRVKQSEKLNNHWQSCVALTRIKLTSRTKRWSMNFLAALGWKSLDSRHLTTNTRNINLNSHLANSVRPEEELVDELQVRPGRLQSRLVLLRIKLCPVGTVGGRKGPEQVYRKHLDDL